MMLKQVMDIMSLCEGPGLDGGAVRKFFVSRGAEPAEIETVVVRGDEGETLFVKLRLRGSGGGGRKKPAPALGVIGRLGGIGARPHARGFVSDADGALCALAAAAELASARARGDGLDADVIFATHLCPDAPVLPHDPVPFMGAPVSMETMNRHEVDGDMAAILSIDATKGNRVLNRRGFAITPTIKQGWILRVSEDLMDIMQNVTGEPPVVLPVTSQDITPYGNRIYHLNSILQPAVATSAPVVGVAITAAVPVAGCATGANQPDDIARAARFAVETSYAWDQGRCRFHDQEEFENLERLYGSLAHLQTPGKT